MEKKSNVLKIIIILLVVVLIATLVIGFLYIRNKEKAGAEAKKPIDENTFPLEEFLVNLKSEASLPSYLKTTIALMYPDKKDEAKLEENVNKIRDIINDQLRIRTSEEMLDIEKVELLKKEIVEAINEALGKEIVHNIYFTDIVVQ